MCQVAKETYYRAKETSSNGSIKRKSSSSGSFCDVLLADRYMVLLYYYRV